MTTTIDGVALPVRSRHQLETLERTQGPLDANITEPDGATWQAHTMTGRPSRRITGARPRLDILGDSTDADAVRWLTGEVTARGGRVLVVGGAVRDAIRTTYGHGNDPVKDLDVEVYGLQPDELANLLASRYDVDETGRSFAVFKLAGCDVDVSLPRRETRTGNGHRAFDVTPDPHMQPETAMLRRDYTINAIGYDVGAATIVDPTGGLADLAARRLRVVSDAFDEDPLRVLRGAQFTARFGLTATTDTITRCRNLLDQAPHLARERIWDEWQKLLTRGQNPGAGLRFLHQTGWTALWPELHNLGTDQLNVVADTLDRWATSRPDDLHDTLQTGSAVLTHLLAPTAATATITTLSVLADLPKQTARLVTELRNLTHHETAPTTIDPAAVRHLAARIERIDLLTNVLTATGRPELAAELDCVATTLGVRTSRPTPLLRGQDLLDAGLKPGRHIGQLLDNTYRAQLDGTVNTTAEALSYALQQSS